MRELEPLLTEASKIANELKRLGEMETDARAAIVSATDEDVTMPAAQQRIADARLTLDVVAARRAKLNSPSNAVRKRLREEFKAAGQKWNDAVHAARLAKEKELVEALLPFWNNDEKRMRHIMGYNLQAATVFHQYREALFHFPFYPDPAEQDLVRDVRMMLAHIQRARKALGLN